MDVQFLNARDLLNKVQELDKGKLTIKFPQPKNKEEEEEFKQAIQNFMNKLDSIFN